MAKNNVTPNIIRKGHLAEKVVIVDGQPGCGKTMLASIIASMDRVELLSYAFEIEFFCRLCYLKKLHKDSAVSLVRMFTDHKLYQAMMGRETNFRYSDLSGVFKDANPWRYFRRIFQQGDMAVPERIGAERPILNLTTHDILGMSWPIFEGLSNRVVLIEVIRHPLYMLIQQTLNFERLTNNPRDIQICIEYGESQLPYSAYRWESLFLSSNAVEKSIYTMKKCLELTEKAKQILKERFSKQILTVPFERFVLDPNPTMKKLEDMLGTEMTAKTRRRMRKQRVPRRKIADSIPLAIYKRCGWEPGERSLSEREELEKRRRFAIDSGASGAAMEVLDELCVRYEKVIWKPE